MSAVKHFKRSAMSFEAYGGPPGDVIWIPEKTAIVYEGEKSVVCWALYPVDWRRRHGLA